ncbi:hypothetical protein PN398_01605 [Romboutsia sp. 1001216sp1]|uniref:hypothetical protein n=1 Tax=unclassified Romboutsia TaxID=2626894 RepID=UPI0018A0070D|nr:MULTISPECIES: hypothetical protein [unclassified Romboutsia]MDB8789407.1 hypothetical protein [Romboutsia sp. 1001216sp1]MDB8802019.1 hypothetical protein [Romboutsia sp. 1001216sp1]MDB8813416.1 hypothetical protein [Romboutsia sp. 1001216sp1]
MKKKIIIGILLIIAIIISIIIASKKDEKDGVYFTDKTYNKEINPISKETAVNIIKAEYGDLVTVNKDDIKKVGDKYKVELFITINDEEHSHKKSIGVHEIDIYTGDMKIVN